MSARELENVVIIGSGPAGYTAALYTARADLEPLVVEGFEWGGLLQTTTDVENYPGYPEGVMGPEMMQQFRDQAERFGTRFITDNVSRVELARDGGIHRLWIGDQEIRAKTVILAMGAEPKKLGVPGEDELAAKGVSYCATCDAAFFRGKPVVVVGGGDSAMEEAIFLTKFASKVTIVHRRDEFRASPIMVDRARANEKIEILTPYVVENVLGVDNGKLTGLLLRNIETDETLEYPTDGLFVAIGHDPTTKLFVDWLDHDENGYLITKGKTTETNVPGVFAAGDVQDHVYRQAITAAGSGCAAALDAERFLAEEEGHLEAALTAPREHTEPA
jgi:thioredoxin reductase (NADPH)